MMQFRAYQHAFSGGETTPLYRRPDEKAYYTTLARCRDAYPLFHGGVTKRPGTAMHIETKYPDRYTRFRRFINSQGDKYMLEFGDQYLRFHTYDSAGNPTLILGGGGSGAGEAMGPLGLTQAGLTPYQVATPYVEADLPRLWFSQSADVLWIFHEDYQTRTLSHSGATDWTLNLFTYRDGPYMRHNTDAAKTLEPSAVTGTITITAAGHAPFVAGDVGRAVRFEHSSVTTGTTQAGWAIITVFTTSALVTAEVQQALPATTATADWRLGAFANSVGWPGQGVFQESRLAVAKNGDVNAPVTIWLSETQGFTSVIGYFQPTRYTDRAVLSDMSIQIPVASDGANDVRWLSPGQVLSVGAANSEWTISAADRTQAISPTNFTVVPHTQRGSAATGGAPLRINASTLFVDRTGTAIREFVYSFEQDAYEAEDRAALVQHLSNPGIEQLLYLQSPHTLMVGRLTDGTLLVIPFIKGQTLNGGALWTFPGGTVESMDTIPTADDKADALWLVMVREIHSGGGVAMGPLGQTTSGVQEVRYIEVLQRPFFQQDRQDAWYMDSAVLYEGAATATITGLDHLEGLEVRPVANGAPLAPVTVESGSITLTNEYEHVLVGLPFTAELETIQFDFAEFAAGRTPPSAIGQRQRINRVQLDLFESGSFSVGLKDGDHQDPINLRRAEDPWNAVEPLRTGIVDVSLAGPMERSASVIIESSDPVPFTLRGVIMDGRYATD